MRVFVAGASGAIGEPLIAELLKQGHSVTGMTTSASRAKFIESQGASVAIADAFDANAVEAALRLSEAEAVIDQLTSLPKELSDMPSYAAGDRKLRIEGGGTSSAQSSPPVSAATCSSPAGSSCAPIRAPWPTNPRHST